MAPAMLVIGLGFDPVYVLVLSQVILSFALPAAIIPLIILTNKRELMGELANGWVVKTLGGLIAGVIISLNILKWAQRIEASVINAQQCGGHKASAKRLRRLSVYSPVVHYFYYLPTRSFFNVLQSAYFINKVRIDIRSYILKRKNHITREREFLKSIAP